MIVRRVEPLSFAKITGLLYGMLGFVLGCFFALISMVGGLASQKEAGPVFGVIFGVGAIFFLPVLYGLLGFVSSLLMAAFYNVAAKMVGGLEIQVEAEPPGGPTV